MINRFERFTCAISEISKYLRKISGDEMEKHGLKSSHSIYFSVLGNHMDTGMTAAQLCAICCRDKADVSRMMAILEDKGLVIKESEHHNLYNGVFKLTDTGYQVALQVNERAIRAVEIAGQDLTAENREIFYDALDSIVSNLRQLSIRGIPE